MLSEEAFNAARIAMTSFGVFFHEIIKEIGVDRTLELSLKPFERFVLEERVPQVKSLLKRNALDLNALAKQFEQYWLMAGYDAKVEATPTSVITTTKRCPFYEAFLEAGHDHSFVEAYCRKKDEVADAIYQQHLGTHAGLKMRKFRTGPDDFCIEETILKK